MAKKYMHYRGNAEKLKQLQHELEIKQDCICVICGDEDAKVYLDHDSGSMKTRSLLCRRCSSMLGYAKDNPEVLRAAADYLEKWNAWHMIDPLDIVPEKT